MANAIKFISVQRGHDVTEYTLACFGGAGGQHACLVADELGMQRVYIHPLAGVLSAYGMGLAQVRALREEAVERPLADGLADAEGKSARLATVAAAEVEAQGVAVERVEKRAHVKYEGTDTALVVPLATADAMKAEFERQYRSRFSFLMPTRALVIEAVSVEAIGKAPAEGTTVAPAQAGASSDPGPRRDDKVAMVSGGESHDTPVFRRESLAPGMRIDGPAIIAERNATTIVEPEWRAVVTAQDHLVLERRVPRATRHALGTTVDPVMLEVFNNLFMSIAEQMGVRLAQTAYSVNIKERLDFSCALFDAEGNLIANAPHMPVHLGSMGESIKTVIRKNAGRMKPGDVYVLNDPYNGGTHLPDVTVITPVYPPSPRPSPKGEGEKPLFYVGSRGHHADIGGITPGSMPPFSHTVEEEGVLLDNVKLVEAGRMLEGEMRTLLASARYPARNPDQNIADLRAQIAANEKGVQELRRMVEHFGLEVVQAYMRHVQDNAEACVRRVIGVLKDGEFAYEMDNGAVIRVKVTIGADRQSAKVDFTGTSAQLESNFNAPSAVVYAAVLYVFRTLVDDDIPLNAGCLKPIEIVIPEGSMLNPRPPAATVAGNVETSQCITDALYGALGAMGASYGTMNNFTFGNARYQYYETISGGTGAGPGFDGASAVQAHMTNSRLTDPEVLEWRFPVRIDGHQIRAGSGGRGRWRGGDGATRRVRFLEPMTAAILAGHRRVPPYGMAGGQPGEVGRNWVERSDGSRTELGFADETEVGANDVFVIETPGGGGYGR
jgi:5-oxoprolinase (ATP-hydrolysing)